MARLSRLVLPGQAHYVIQRGHNGQPVFADDADRATYEALLRETAAAQQVLLHAWALPATEVQLLATPPDAAALSRMMQALGRRYVSTHNRRHGRSGTLWDGRFRCAVVEPGAAVLEVLRLVDGLATDGAPSSAAHRSGGRRDPALVDPPAYWHLGNTPFEREAAYRRLLDTPLPMARAQALRRAALGGWAVGTVAFAAQAAAAAGRPALPRAPGRPRRISQRA